MKQILDGILPGEEILPDDYPVHWDYFYVCDAKVRVSPIGGGSTVRHLKTALGITEVRSCDMAARGFYGGGSDGRG